MATSSFCTSIRMQSRFGLISAFLILFPSFSFAQNVSPYPGLEVRFQHLLTDGSLPLQNVFSISQDADGFIWFGTLNGASRFDGMSVRTIPTGLVGVFHTDKKGRFWMCGRGLAQLDTAGDSLVVYIHDPKDPYSLGGVDVRALVEDEDGTFWLGHSNGLDRFDPESRSFERITGVVTSPIISMVDDKRGHLWIGSRTSIIRFTKGSRSVDRVPLDPRQVWVGMAVGPDGTIWACGNITFGLQAIDPRSLQPTEVTEDGNRIDAVQVVFDTSGVMYVGSMSGGLKILQPGSGHWTTLRNSLHDPGSISSNHIHDVFIDRAGNLWVGTAKGLSWSARSHKPFLHIIHDPDDPSSPPPEPIVSTVADEEGRVWIGSRGAGVSVFTFNDKTCKRVPGIEGIVAAMCADHRGLLWVSTREPAGFWKVDTRTTRITSARSFLRSSKGHERGVVTAVTLDRDGNLWLGFEGIAVGCLPADGSPVKMFELDSFPDVLSDGIRQMLRDNRGDVWVAGGANGIVRLDPLSGEWHRIGAGKRFTSIHEDHLGQLWVGSDAGLDLLLRETETFEHVPEDPASGYPPGIIDIIQDDAGILWLIGMGRIIRFDPMTRQGRDIGAHQGYPVTSLGAHVAFGTSSTFVKSNGMIVLGSGDGIITFHPESIRWNYVPPPVVITAVMTTTSPASPPHPFSNLGLREPGPMEIPYDQGPLEFRFAALDFAAPEGNIYSVKLEGLDEDWLSLGTVNTIRYGTLTPGEYTFRVRAANNDGVWNMQGTSLPIVVTPPWWRTSWAFALFLMVLIGFLYGAWRMKARRLAMVHAYETSRFQAQKLAEIDEMKSRFFTNISHEFRTPLSLILGPVKQIAESTRDGKLRDELQMVQRNARRLLRLVNQLLDIAKLESGSMQLRAAPMDVVPFLKEVTQSFSPHADRKRITLQLTAPEAGISVYLDREQAEKIIMNLLSNAFAFTPEGGRIDVAAERAHGMLKITVADTGIGIATTSLPRIFDRFYQVSSGHPRTGQGTGVGLSLTRDLVMLHKGTIAVESEEGRGTTFTVTLPLGSEHLLPEEISDAPTTMVDGTATAPELSDTVLLANTPYDPARARIKDKPSLLIVEDNHDVRTYVASTLDHDFRVIQSVDGEEGISACLQHLPDLVVCDVMMPRMDGMELCSRIKADERTCHIPIILLTAKATMRDRIEGLETGADAYITKPFEPEELLATIRNLLAQRSRLHEQYAKRGLGALDNSALVSADRRFLARVEEAIARDLSNQSLHVESLAEMVGVSRSVLHRKIVSLTGQPPVELIRRFRLARAAELIIRRSGNMAEVAFEVGFTNPSYFSECFKRQYGVPPSQYSKQFSSR